MIVVTLVVDILVVVTGADAVVAGVNFLKHKVVPAPGKPVWAMGPTPVPLTNVKGLPMREPGGSATSGPTT